ncbi:DUF2835 domain-containing protein [Alkalimarinus coralli]|uniref:DUF2835 domain-containing protein n=1 Tax=Alkalimarinus coralli TaxID=2935863 RepID=UPI0035175BA7
MQKISIDLTISADEWLKIYRGSARTVSATSRDGRRIQFPANILQQYVTHFGISGSFDIYFDDQGKFSSIIKTA